MSDAQQLQETNQKLKRFILKRDATSVHAACDGTGTDDDLLTKVLCERNKAQLQVVRQAYFDKYNKTLEDELKSECGGKYCKFLLSIIKDRADFDANTLQEAMEGVGCNEEVVVELYLTRSAAELEAMRECWEGRHDTSLLDRLKEELGGDMEKFILKLFKSKNDSEDADPELAENQANELYEAGPGKMFGTDEEPFIKILAKSSRPQIELIKRAFEERRNHSLAKAIEKEFGGKTREAFLGALEDPLDFLCTKLRAAFNGVGTDEATIVRIIGGFDKPGAQALAERYQAKYDRSLVADIESEVGGNLRRALVRWINGKDCTEGMWYHTEHPMPTDEDGLNVRLQHLTQEQDALRRCLASWDALLIQKACKGMGTDEKSIIDIICKRTKEQTDAIDMRFRERASKTLREAFESELSGDFKTFAVYTQMTEDEFDAHLIRDAVDGLGTNEDLLLEVICTRSHERLENARAYYEKRHDENLVDRLNSELKGDLKKLANRLLTRNRDEDDGKFDPDNEAEKLYEASVGKTFGTDEAKFVQIFSKRSVAQLKTIGQTFETRYGRSLQGVVEKEFDGDLRDALIALMSEPVEFFAFRLKEAFEGAGTDEDLVCRILGGNNKATALRIAQVYFEKYDKQLIDDLTRELSGNLRRAATKWVKSQDPTRGDDETEEPETESEPAASPESMAALAAAAIAAPAIEEEEEKAVPPPAMPADDDDEDDDGDDDDEDAAQDEARAARLAARRERAAARRAAREAQKAAVMEQKRRQKQKQQELAQRQNAVAQLVKSREDLAKSSLAAITGAKLPATGALVGSFDEELYCRLNGVGGDAWNHFLENGFNEGCVLTVKTPVGLFAGIFDHEVYLSQRDIEPVRLDQPPYHPQQQAFADLKENGDVAQLPIKPAVAVIVYGQFSSALYFQTNPDAAAYAHKPRGGAFDGASYVKIHPDARGSDPLEHFIKHGLKHKYEIVVNGRRGKLDKRWFKRHNDTKKVKKYLKKKPNARMKVKGRRMHGWQHFATFGHNEGRRVCVANGLGIFEGVFDAAGYLALNPDVSEDAWAHYRDQGHDENRMIAISDVQMHSLFLETFESMTAEAAVDDSSLAPQEPVSSDEEDDDDDDSDDDSDDD